MARNTRKSPAKGGIEAAVEKAEKDESRTGSQSEPNARSGGTQETPGGDDGIPSDAPADRIGDDVGGTAEDVPASASTGDPRPDEPARSGIEDAEVLSERTPGPDASHRDETVDGPEFTSHSNADGAEDDTLYVDPMGNVSDPDVSSDDDLSGTKSGSADADDRAETSYQMVAPPPPADERRGGGFWPLVLGGLVAGAIGYSVPAFLLPQDATDVQTVDPEQVAALEQQVATLEATLAAPPEVDLGGLAAGQSDLATRFAALDERLTDLEARPAPSEVAANVTDSIDAEGLRAQIATLRDELGAATGDLTELRDELSTLSGGVSTLGDDVSTLRGDLSARVEAVEAGLEDAAAQADAAEADAEAIAREAARNQVRLALESGAAYADSLELLPDAPAALAAPAETGVATVAELSADFPPLARDALRSARSADPEAGVGSLFRNALNARSLEPREGNDPDAVLSRAEAAMRAGDVDGALGEIEALPEAARTGLSDWVERARTRSEAVSAANDFLMDG